MGIPEHIILPVQVVRKPLTAPIAYTESVLPSGTRLRLATAGSNRFRNSIIPTAISLLNARGWWGGSVKCYFCHLYVALTLRPGDTAFVVSVHCIFVLHFHISYCFFFPAANQLSLGKKNE